MCVFVYVCMYVYVYSCACIYSFALNASISVIFFLAAFCAYDRERLYAKYIYVYMRVYVCICAGATILVQCIKCLNEITWRMQKAAQHKISNGR